MTTDFESIVDRARPAILRNDPVHIKSLLIEFVSRYDELTAADAAAEEARVAAEEAEAESAPTRRGGRKGTVSE